MEYYSCGAADTRAFAAEFAKKLKGGELIAFYGDLGAGKTQFSAGVAEGLGYSGLVTSPTYTILQVYKSNPPIAHFDMYRIETELQLENTGFFDYLSGGYIVLVEWAENIDSYLPQSRYEICIEYAGENDRKITVKEPHDC